MIASDFYNASATAQQSDKQIGDSLMQQLLPQVQPVFRDAQGVDQELRRYPESVWLFSPGSLQQRPPMETSLATEVCAGDWARMGEREFDAEGLWPWLRGMPFIDLPLRFTQLGCRGDADIRRGNACAG